MPTSPPRSPPPYTSGTGPVLPSPSTNVLDLDIPADVKAKLGEKSRKARENVIGMLDAAAIVVSQAKAGFELGGKVIGGTVGMFLFGPIGAEAGAVVGSMIAGACCGAIEVMFKVASVSRIAVPSNKLTEYHTASVCQAEQRHSI